MARAIQQTRQSRSGLRIATDDRDAAAEEEHEAAEEVEEEHEEESREISNETEQ